MDWFNDVGGANKDSAIYRRPNISAHLVQWDWSANNVKSDAKTGSDYTDLTPSMLSFQWLKTIKNMAARCVVDMLAQFGDTHYLNIINAMDVIKIYEFDELKYMGYVTRIGASGSIDPQTGKPIRKVTLYLSSFGEMVINGSIGVSLFLQASNSNANNTNFVEMGAALNSAWSGISDLIKSNNSYSMIIGQIIQYWLKFIVQLGGSSYVTYFNYFIDSNSGLVGETIPRTPRQPFMFSSEDSNVNLHDILQKFAQAPFNEIFMDCGSRTIYSETDEYLSGVKSTNLVGEKDHIITRHALFDGCVDDSGGTKNLWFALPSVKLPIGYLTRFDLNKTMEESYSMYLVAPAIFNIGDLGLIADGQAVLDTVAFNKYLLREMDQQLFYDTYAGTDDSLNEGFFNSQANLIDTDSANKSLMLKQWYEKNDQFLSGTFTMEVPSNSSLDPRIGDKIEWDAVEDAYFYVEGVSHTWSYGGELSSTLSVTRGYGEHGPIKLTDKIFKRGIFAIGEGFK
jgi:hypothetical protein